MDRGGLNCSRRRQGPTPETDSRCPTPTLGDVKGARATNLTCDSYRQLQPCLCLRYEPHALRIFVVILIRAPLVEPAGLNPKPPRLCAVGLPSSLWLRCFHLPTSWPTDSLKRACEERRGTGALPDSFSIHHLQALFTSPMAFPL
jgi:hypothetical protein